MSPGYNRQRAYFQFLGWTVIGLLFLIGLLCLCVAKCKHPLTYYHSKYHAVYQMKEKDLFKAKLQNKVSGILYQESRFRNNFNFCDCDQRSKNISVQLAF